MARPIARRRLAPILAFVMLGATAVLGATSPVKATTAHAFPVLSLGDRGTDVATVQQLFRFHQGNGTVGGDGGSGRDVSMGGMNPLIVPVDGFFGALTLRAIRAFQASRDLPVTGFVDAGTWDRLIVPLGPGAQGDPVVALQRELREKRSATAVPMDGVYESATRSAVTAFQAHMGIPQTGSVDARTWRLLIWHFELPRFSAAGLCDNSTGNGPANWGTAEMTSTLEAAGSAMVKAGYGRVVVNDVSHEHGGEIAGHETHEIGLDADIRPMRKANDQCSVGTRWTMAAYDRDATRALILAIRTATPGHLKIVFFNDPVLIAEGLTRYHGAHDDHLHVRLCQASHPDPRYRC